MAAALPHPSLRTVASFERTGTGCVEDPDWPAGGPASDAGPGYVRTSGTVTADADRSVWAERTPPAGADLGTFRVHVESHHEGQSEADCAAGSVVGCSAGYTGGLDGSCDPFFEEPRRSWANATG